MDQLDNPEFDLSTVIEKLDEISCKNGLNDEIQSEIDAVKAKYEHVRELIMEHKKIEKKKKKIADEKDIVTLAMSKAANSMATCSTQTKLLEERIERKSKSLQREKMRLDSGPDVWQLLGLRCVLIDTNQAANDDEQEVEGENENNNNVNGVMNGGDMKVSSTKKLLQEGNYSFQFSKIDPNDLNSTFEVKVRISNKYLNNKNGSCFKIYESSPSDLLSSPEIDTIESTAGSDSRYLILLIRKHIEAKLGLSPSNNKRRQPAKEVIEQVSASNGDAKESDGEKDVQPKFPVAASRIPKTRNN